MILPWGGVRFRRPDPSCGKRHADPISCPTSRPCVGGLRRASRVDTPIGELETGTGGLRISSSPVQMLQMVHGASDITAGRDTLTALEQLATWGYVGRDDARALRSPTGSWQHLGAPGRSISLVAHSTPCRPMRQPALVGVRWGCARTRTMRGARRRRSQARDVRRLHEKLFYRLCSMRSRGWTWAGRLTPQAAEDRHDDARVRRSEGKRGGHLESLSSGVSRRAAIQRTLLPVMLGWFADAPDPDAGLFRIPPSQRCTWRNAVVFAAVA